MNKYFQPAREDSQLVTWKNYETLRICRRYIDMYHAIFFDPFLAQRG